MSLTRTAATFAPPVMEARRWLDDVSFPADRPLINVSQAAPVDPPPDALRQAMAEVALTCDDAHLYGPVLGLPALRDALAAETMRIYGGTVSGAQIAITSGCNQAFAAAVAALCAEGDEVILPTPWYFNHKMWLDMAGVRSVPLKTDDALLPGPSAAEALITPRTRAIALVSPNNPAGVEYSTALIRAFFELAKRRGIKLILDETYRDFHAQEGPPHDLFQDAAWSETLVHLYSFSKAYRLTGHRIGAIGTQEDLLSEVEKFLDTVAICPGQIGQHAALWGMQNLRPWLAGERDEILARRAAIAEEVSPLEQRGWRLLGLGAYFAYMQHPFEMASDDLARSLVRDQSILCLPGTMFCPENDPSGRRHLRIAFANLDRAGIAQLFQRLLLFEPSP